MGLTQNLALRVIINDMGLSWQEVAREMGIRPESLSRILAKEVTEKRKAQILQAAVNVSSRRENEF